MKALVVGRFQPLHKGHLMMFDYVAGDVDELVVGVGSSNHSNTIENPFSFDERRQMIEESFKPKICHEIIAIPDVDDDRQWIQNVVDGIEFDVIYTNADHERKIFESAGIGIRDIPFFDRMVYSATNVRKHILDDSSWRDLVPQGTVDVIERVDGIGRIRALYAKTNF
jgi:nicotinamide-nucleotide adenylyltransferase